jgi:signal transduction histidine kinase
MRRDLEQTRRLELQLARLRWLAALFGATVTAIEAATGTGTRPLAGAFAAAATCALLIGNALIVGAAHRAGSPRQIRALGILAFALDTVAALGLVWVSARAPSDPAWVLAYLLPLEGAVRYGVPGALAPVPLILASEILREAWLDASFVLYRFQATAVAFRVGMATVVALVAGLFASSMRREAERAQERTRLAEEEALRAEAAAEREAEARRDLVAFHTAILAGVAAADAAEGIQAIAEAVGRELGCEALGILLVEPADVGADRLVAAGVWGTPGYDRGTRFVQGTGPIDLEELSRPELRSDPPEAVVPLRAGDDVIGILHERTTGGELDRDRLLLLGRLADQISLVVQASSLRIHQEETLVRLRELDEMKSDFVAITSHELRTPLSAIRGFVDSLIRRMDQLSPEEAREFLDIIRGQTDRLIRLVEDLLLASRIEAGRLTLVPEAMPTAVLMTHVRHGLGDEADRVRIVDDGMPEELVADGQRLTQILTNLLVNALRYSPADVPVLLSAESRSPGTVTFTVTDRGPGIAPEEQERIFERFHQSESSSSHAEGAGLGLYIAKQLAEAMGGWISLTSTPGGGASFAVTIPSSRGLLVPAPLSGVGRSGRTAS